jgi:hypothetical protein
MAEWSKAVDLRSTIFGCAGSNPAGSIFKKSYSNYLFAFETLVKFNSPPYTLYVFDSGLSSYKK